MRFRITLFPRKEIGLSQQKLAAFRTTIIGFQIFPATVQLVKQRIVVEMQSRIGGRACNLLLKDRDCLIETAQILQRFGAVAYEVR